LTKSFGFSIAIYGAQIPGYFSAAWLNEKIGRKGVVASYMTLGGIAAIMLSLSHTGMQIMAAGIWLSDRSAAWLNEKIGRKGVVASYMTLGGIAAIMLSLSHTGMQIMAAGICLSF